MYRYHRTADMLGEVARLLTFAADELRDCARSASVADDRACAAIDQADMLQRQLDRVLDQKPGQKPAPTPGPLPMPECRDDGPTPTAATDDGAPPALRAPGSEVVSTWRLPVAEPDAPPPLDAPAPAPGARTRGGRRRRSEGEGQPGQGEGQTPAPAPAPDAATEAEAVEQVAQVLGDALRDVSGDLFGEAPAPAPADDFLPL